MRAVGERSLKLIVATLASIAIVTPGVLPATADSSPIPAQWAATCSAVNLGLEGDTVAWAPVLNGDVSPNGGPVTRAPEPGGAWYPVVMVHGWVGSDTIANPNDRSGNFSQQITLSSKYPFSANIPRSLIGQLQGIPGAAVFTFDYHPYSGRWVDDGHIGPALGKVIDCLYKASGRKVIIVAHSMGGIAARWAANQAGVSGPDRSGEISSVVTFGTPETGSVIAALLADAGSLTADTAPLLSSIRLILSACGQLSARSVETGTICDRLPAYIRAIDGPAGIALRANSPQIEALTGWPRGIFVDAIAGDTTFEVPSQSGWFGLPWSTTKLSGAGDMLVTKDSAVSGAQNATSLSCDYQFSAQRAAADRIGLLLSVVSNADAAQIHLNAFSGACFHADLMRELNATNEALGAVADDISSRSDVTPTELQTAEVPADCGLPAQRLQNNTTTEGSPGSGGLVGQALYADFAGLGYKQALAEYECNGGGVGWPEVLVLIGGGGKLLASLDLGDVVSAEHSDVTAATLDGNTAKVAWESYEGAGFLFVHQTATVSFKDGRLVLGNHVTDFSPERVVSDILVAESAHDRNSLRDPDVVTDTQWAEFTTQYSMFAFGGEPSDPCTVSGSTAICPISGAAPGPVLTGGTMTLQRSTSGSYGWKVVDLQIGGD